ncbi:MAG: 2-C-methyl-D-erythritol 4-phosphate cytidylyltransferase [Prevotella sp.]|nr:2-C-methyl-D-erythritol 4-phosphate cytidylyltransferase [Prevotella sp.]
MTDYIIIVAGGKGLRMGSDIPKQFLPIGGKPVLMRTLERFREYSSTLQIILVLPKTQQEYWKELCQKHNFTTKYMLADGGDTRFHSVKNGLALIPDDTKGVVGVHDGVRPFPSIDVIRHCYEIARTSKAVIPVIPVVETIRHIIATEDSTSTLTDSISTCKDDVRESPLLSAANNKSVTVPRDDYRLVQTPQTFDIQLLKAANRQPYNDGFTDDASVVEAFGFDITLVEGNRENIKITTPFDMTIAEALLQRTTADLHGHLV